MERGAFRLLFLLPLLTVLLVVLPLGGALRAALVETVRAVTAALVDFATEDRKLFGSFDSHTERGSGLLENLNNDVVTDGDIFAGFQLQ